MITVLMAAAVAAVPAAQAQTVSPATAIPPAAVQTVPSQPATARPVAPPAASGTELGFVSGRNLYARCIENSAGSISYCFAYLAAVHDTMRAYEIWLNMSEFCVPAVTSQGDLRTAFVRYALQHPIDLEGQAASVVVNALKDQYPCIRSPSAPIAPGASPFTTRPATTLRR
jgi:hypothetical protein